MHSERRPLTGGSDSCLCSKPNPRRKSAYFIKDKGEHPILTQRVVRRKRTHTSWMAWMGHCLSLLSFKRDDLFQQQEPARLLKIGSWNLLEGTSQSLFHYYNEAQKIDSSWSLGKPGREITFPSIHSLSPFSRNIKRKLKMS